jgi:type IV pilus biogenesis/stability protein PilW
MKRAGYLMVTICLLGLMGCATTDNNSLKTRQFEAQRNLGEAYLRQGDYTTALRELLKAEAMNPDDPYLQDSLGTVYAAKDRLEEAVAHFQRALSLKPDYAPARNNLGSVYLLQKKWDEAISCLKPLTGSLLYATPQYPLYNLGWAYYNKGNYEQAEKYYQKALDIEPDYARALWGLGLIHLSTGKMDAAQKELEEAVKNAPTFAQAYWDLGNLYRQRGQDDKAIAAYKKVMRLAPAGLLFHSAEKALSELRPDSSDEGL